MRRLVACIFLSVFWTATALATDYLSVIPDLPLPEGLSEATKDGAVFDAPTGRIATAYASGMVAPGAIRDFYDQALPQLGWEVVTQGTYRRQSETLKIDVLGGEGGAPSNVSFTLSAESQ
jgi:hypothetical protein